MLARRSRLHAARAAHSDWKAAPFGVEEPVAPPAGQPRCAGPHALLLPGRPVDKPPAQPGLKGSPACAGVPGKNIEEDSKKNPCKSMI